MLGRLAICAVFPEVPAAQSELGKRVDRHTDHAHGFYCVARVRASAAERDPDPELATAMHNQIRLHSKEVPFLFSCSERHACATRFWLRIIFLEWMKQPW